LANRPLARRFSPYLEGKEPLLVSAIEIYEVFTADTDFEGLPGAILLR
jgi:hypothetical protein